MRKGGQFLEGESGFLDVAIIIYVQTERCLSCYFYLMFLAFFVLLKVFLTVFYFINSLFKRKSVKKLTQVSIKDHLPYKSTFAIK